MNNTKLCCPHCSTANRLPSDRLTDAPTCGKCKGALFEGRVVELTASNVTANLQHNDVPLLVDCWAPWCGPCRGFAPTFAQAAVEFEPRLRLAKLNTEQEQDVAGRWQIRSLPTLILFKQGVEVTRMSGALSLSQLKQWLVQQGVS